MAIFGCKVPGVCGVLFFVSRGWRVTMSCEAVKMTRGRRVTEDKRRQVRESVE